MEDLPNPINQKASILLSRNHPIALVVGAAGFLGSHLVEKLLKLHIQVIGVDDLSTGRKENLTGAFKEKNFHFFNLSIAEDQIDEYLADLPRLDYAFFVAENPVSSALYKIGLENFLKLVLKYKDDKPLKKEHPKTVLVSSIDSYETAKSSNLNFLKSAEENFARFSKTHQLNARIVRLAEVYGPKMHFRHKGSITRLIRASLEGKLMEEQTTLEFSSRGLFIDDAINLLTKAVLAGSTSGKIYDGCLMQPIKITEIKQILLDPVWYKHRGFSPTELPPWPTPNLSKTISELSWKPKAELIESLKQTLDFFEEDKAAKSFALEQSEDMERGSKLKVPGWSFEQLEPKDHQGVDHKAKPGGDLRHLPRALFVVLLFVGIIFPFANFFMGSFYLPQNLFSAKRSFEAGEFEQSKRDLALAGVNVAQMQSLTNMFLFLKNSSVWKNQLPKIVEYVDGQDLLVRGADKLLMGISQQLDNSQSLFLPLKTDLYLQSEQDLSQSLARLSDPQLKELKFIPNLDQALDLTTAQSFYHHSQQTRVVNNLLPQLFPQSESKSYLVVWQNNSYLSPSGGELIAFSKLNWANGKLNVVDGLPMAELDQKLALVGPLYAKKGSTTTVLNFSNLKDEASFASFGQYFLTLYQKTSGEVANGVFLIDTQGLEALKQAVDGDVGPQAKLMEDKDASRSGQAAQALSTLTTSLVGINQNKVLKVASVLGEQLDQKHLLIYSDNPKSLGLLNSQNWSTSLAAKDETGNEDFLQVNYSYLGGALTKSINRSFNLQTQISSGGEVAHTLRINFQNKSSEAAQNRLQLFLPLGTRLTGANFVGGTVLNKFNSLVDFGRAVYVTNLNLAPNSSSELELSYSLAGNLTTSQNLLNYSFKISKQAGTDKDPLAWQLFVPEGWQAVNLPKEASLGSGGLEIKTDLTTDKIWDFSFKKP